MSMDASLATRSRRAVPSLRGGLCYDRSRSKLTAPAALRACVGDAIVEDSSWASSSIIGIIIVGFLVGVLARWFYPGVVPMGFILTTILGIAGSFLGGLLGSILFKSPDGNFHPAGWVLSVIGAIIIIWGYFTFLK